MTQSVDSRLPLSLPSGSLLTLGAAGVVLLVVAGWTLMLLLQIWPLTSQLAEQIRLEEAPATLSSDVSAHLATQGLTVILCVLGGGLALSLFAHLRKLAAGGTPSRAPVQLFGWGLKVVMALLPVGMIVSQVLGTGDPYGPAHSLMSGSFAVMSVALSLLLLVPLAALTWITIGRLEHWLELAGSFVQTAATNRQLQRRFHLVSHPLVASTALLALPLLFLLPVLLIERAPSVSIQLPIQRLMVDQQTPLMQLTLLGSLAATLGVWQLRWLLNLLTHHLDPQLSRISNSWKPSSSTQSL